MKSLTFAARNDAVTRREDENRKIARLAASEGIVLLKNEDHLLPLADKRIALFGAGASHTVKGGTGSGEVNERHAVTILEGLEKAGFEITSYNWLYDYIASYDKKPETKNKKTLDVVNMLQTPPMPYGRLITDEDLDADTETAIYVAARQAGEGGDKRLENDDFDLSDIETDNLRKLTEHYKNVILVINSGSSMSLSRIDDLPVKAVLFFCQMGMEGGNAFADVLTGKVNPSGKLTDTWVNSYSDVPAGDSYSYLSGDLKNQYYKEGIYVGYRYYDTFNIRTRYPFGFGLSYTTFDITSHAFFLDPETQQVLGKATVRNTGTVPGKEVVQVYVNCPDGKLKKEYKRLTAFKKTRLLAPGEEEELDLSFPFSYMASYSEEEASWILEKGSYLVRIGTSSDNSKVSVVVRLTDTAVVSRNQNLCVPAKRVEEIEPAVRIPDDDLENLPVLTLNPEEIVTQIIEYKDPLPASDLKTDAVMSRLTDDDMIDVCVGEGIGGMMTTNKFFTPGAVGRTTSKLYKKGLINVSLSDGPAGLRLLRVSGLTKKNKLKFVKGNSLLSVMDSMGGPLAKVMQADEKKDELLYQYTTAFPVGTSLAQTWNTELCYQVGEALSLEMEEYGITYWLGPAMNIHKNPLCGRNFEYMSEDPVLTGKIASALVRGAQSLDGNYATIKHFACNNAEDDRNHSNSHVNERALREIYLRGFEIAVKEGKAASVMSSYNMLNDIYTPDSHDLLTGILRNEWGFDGLVMTDWFSTVIAPAKSGTALHAGNDLLMPGMFTDKADIKKALKDGRLSRLDLRRCAANVVRQIVHSRVSKRVKPEMFE
ncbi:MAG: glycoside hydrolase family 3 C-terminal domain-containing protein [Lachnospiraceae bacterium]|nr:glycoside hydrolase family 3 C-terminal domain-containing protein [Lachnospiraceae bacterium]